MISAFVLVLDFLEMVDEVEEDVTWMDDRASLAFGRFPQMVLLYKTHRWAHFIFSPGP